MNHLVIEGNVLHLIHLLKIMINGTLIVQKKAPMVIEEDGGIIVVQDPT